MQEKNAGASPEDLRPIDQRGRRKHAESVLIDLYLKGYSMRDLPRMVKQKTKCGFTAVKIKKVINQAIRQWEASKADQIQSHKARELEKISKVEIEFWEAWERSKGAAVTTTVKRKKPEPGKKLQISEENKQEKKQVGDARFLAGIQWCVEWRCKLLGLEIPKPQEKDQTPAQQGAKIIKRKFFVSKHQKVANVG